MSLPVISHHTNTSGCVNAALVSYLAVAAPPADAVRRELVSIAALHNVGWKPPAVKAPPAPPPPPPAPAPSGGSGAQDFAFHVPPVVNQFTATPISAASLSGPVLNAPYGLHNDPMLAASSASSCLTAAASVEPGVACTPGAIVVPPPTWMPESSADAADASLTPVAALTQQLPSAPVQHSSVHIASSDLPHAPTGLGSHGLGLPGVPTFAPGQVSVVFLVVIVVVVCLFVCLDLWLCSEHA